MGQLVDGVWQVSGLASASPAGRFERRATAFRHWITADGRPGPSGSGGFKAEAGRYLLYVSLACPWAQRTLIMRRLKGLERLRHVAVGQRHMGEQGWTFAPGPGATGEPLFGFDYLHQLYRKAEPAYTGRVTVPVLWDKATGQIVSNESAEIIVMLNDAFQALGAQGPDYYPERMRGAIDAVNQTVYDTVNNGVYKAGFATRQAAYEEAVLALFATLDALDQQLGRQRFLAGDQLTLADIRLYTTLARFDPVYVGHFKCNLRRLVDYPNLWPYARALFQRPGFGDTTDFAHIKQHYYGSHPQVNPTGIVPIGPEIDWQEPHGRG